MRHFSDLPRMLGSSLLSSMVGSALFVSALFVGCNSKLNAGVTALATQAITPAAQAIIVKLTTGMHIQAGIYEKSRCSVRYYQKKIKIINGAVGSAINRAKIATTPWLL